MAISLGDALLKIGIEASEFNKGMEETDKKVKTMTEKWQTALKVTGTAFTAMGAAGLGFVNQAKDMNAQLGLTADSLGISTTEMRNLALATANAGLPINEVQKSFDLLARAGVKNTAEMRATTEAFDALGDVAGVGADTVANMLIPAYKAFGKTLPTTSAEMDKFTWLTRNTTIDLGDFSTVMSRMAPDMNKMGLSMDDAVVYMAALSKQGIEGRKATQAFSQAISMTTKSQEDYVQAVALAVASGESQESAQARLAGMQITFGQAIGITNEQLQTYKTEIDGATGSTDRLSTIAESNIGIIDKLKNGFKEFGLKVGTALTPLEPLLGVMTAMGPVMMAVSTAQGMAAVKTAGHTIALVAQKTAIVAVQTATVAWKILMAGITLVTQGWTAAQAVLNGVMTANPIGVIVLAIAALIAIIVLLVKNWDHVVKFFKDSWEVIKNAFSAVGQFFEKVWNGIVNFFKGAINAIINFFKKFGDDILLIMFPIPTLIIKNWDKIVDFFKDLWDRIKTAFVAVWEAIKSAWEAVVNFFKTAFEVIVGFYTAIWERIKAVFIAVWEFLKSAWQGFVDAIKAIWQGIVEFFSGIWNAIVGAAQAVWNGIVGFFTGIVDGIKNAWNSLTEFFSNLWNGILNVFKSVINAILGIVEGFVNFFVKAINWIIGGFNKIQVKIPDWVPLIGGKGFGVNIPLVGEVKLPRLAEGGIAMEPTLAVVGDNPKGEVIAPLDRLMPANQITQVIVKIGEDTLIDRIDKGLDKRKRIQLVV